MFIDADTFLRTDQLEFGSAWRYELVCGAIVAHAAPSPEHGSFLGNLAAALHGRLLDHSECRLEIGSGLFEVISPSELQHKREWDQKRCDFQAVEGVQGIIGIFQDETLVHAHRRQGTLWTFQSIAGAEAKVALSSIGFSVSLAVLYDRVLPEGE